MSAFLISVWWSIDKPNFCVSLPHPRSTTASLETNPLYSEVDIYFSLNILLLLLFSQFLPRWRNLIEKFPRTHQKKLILSGGNCMSYFWRYYFQLTGPAVWQFIDTNPNLKSQYQVINSELLPCKRNLGIILVIRFQIDDFKLPFAAVLSQN